MKRPQIMSSQQQPDTIKQPGFSPLRLFLTVLLLLLGISIAAQWYARSVTLPRYCQHPTQTLNDVHRLLTEERPAGDGERKPYIIAARLTFLLPRNSEEPLAAYLDRLHRHLEEQCR